MEKKAATEDKRKQEQKYDEIYSETKRRRMSFWMLSELERRAEEVPEPSSSARPSGEHEQGDSGGGSSSGLVRNPNRAHHSDSASASLHEPHSSPSSGRESTVLPPTVPSDESTHDQAGNGDAED